MVSAFRRWRQEGGVRGIGPGIKGTANEWYIKWAPNFGASLPWFGGRRIRIAKHHGVQIVRWLQSGRWVVARQLLGRSTVKGEIFDAGRR